MSWDQLLDPGVHSWRSEVESDRFGRSVDRLMIGPGPIDHELLLALLDDLTADVVIVRHDAAQLELPATFARSRRAVVPAGALTYWEKSVRTPTSGLGDLEVRSADAEDDLAALAAVVREVVRASFADYGNHYSANPLFDRVAAAAGYEDWAVRSLSEDPANVLVMREMGIPIGVATLEPGADGTHVEVLLAGMLPSAQGKGLYAQLVRGCESAAEARGADRLVISTQVHNIRVQRAWARCGLRPFAALETVHLIRRELLTPHPERRP